MISDFKVFVSEKFMEHKDECRWWKVPCKYQTLNSYVKKNKWWLKREFKRQTKS